AQNPKIPPLALLRCSALGGSGGRGETGNLKEQRRDDNCTFHNHLPVRDLKPVNTSHSTVRKPQSENRSRKHMEDDGMKAALRATYSRSSCTAVTPRSNSRPCWSSDERRIGSRGLLRSRSSRPRPAPASSRIAEH